jgi:hypothetical protein
MSSRPTLRPPADEEFFRRLILPEERKQRQFTGVPWRGDFRWFASPNVVALEQYRTLEEWRRVCAVFFDKAKE